KTYESEFGKRMRGEGLFADLLANRFKLALKRLDMNTERLKLNTQIFQVPESWRAKNLQGQMPLF
ncbi:MAG TPA: radical SAM protein, partial [Methylotenera sp.]|nr:radical SAM protein [Methylotenera sp.]